MAIIDSDPSSTLTAPPVQLNAPGITLREWSDTEEALVIALFDDREVADRGPTPYPFRAVDAHAYLNRARRARTYGARLHLAVVPEEAGHPVGEVILNLLGATIGYVVRADHRGSGLAQRAAAAVIDYAHRTLALPEVFAQIEDQNAASVAVARKLGFQRAPYPLETVAGTDRRFVLRTWVHSAAELRVAA